MNQGEGLKNKQSMEKTQQESRACHSVVDVMLMAPDHSCTPRQCPDPWGVPSHVGSGLHVRMIIFQLTLANVTSVSMTQRLGRCLPVLQEPRKPQPAKWRRLVQKKRGDRLTAQLTAQSCERVSGTIQPWVGFQTTVTACEIAAASLNCSHTYICI